MGAGSHWDQVEPDGKENFGAISRDESHSITHQGFERLSNLRKLEILDLGSNDFDDNNIFHSLGALTSIKTLIISDNALGGYFPAHGIIEKLGNIGYKHQWLSWPSPNARINSFRTQSYCLLYK
ncbi:hypothetical protein HYC85_027687 [Camellia sinensis]|uniref:Leucine-rich repeat-containing N-terminal plant-type domain-containing protein n=1 Tax=Camellia sinensis TaxID=4442 RepID=A0A7J7FX04_CAMSI|nr:hypothetical protein HYC85_027687 [Camellia sinensis]